MLEILNSTHAVSPDLQKKCQDALSLFMQKKLVGFPDLPLRLHLWTSTSEVGAWARENFKDLVVIGIGGSSLGARAIVEAMNVTNVHFLDNVDPIEYARVLARLKSFESTCFAAISKSGTTIETLCAIEFLEQDFSKKGLTLKDRTVVITENKESSLLHWAKEHKLKTLEVPLDVGGRFSVLSPVGMFVASFAGLSIDGFKLGATEALNDRATVSQLMGHFVESFSREEWITLFWFYSSPMKNFGLWIQQLWAESLAKTKTKAGAPAPRVSTPMMALGAVDQHSILQQVMEGTKDKFVVFVRVAACEGGSEKLAASQFKETSLLVNRPMGALLSAEAQATQAGLEKNGVSTLGIRTKGLSEENLGYLFMAFQLVVAGLGEYLEIDAFDQPGVELGKRLAKDILLKA